MEINSEIYDNLYDFIQNLEIRIQKNVFHSNHSEQLSTFSNDLFQLCKTKELNVLLNDITSLPSYLYPLRGQRAGEAKDRLEAQ